MFEIAGLAIGGIAALSSVVQAYYAAKSANKDLSNAVLLKSKKRAEKPLKNGVKVVANVIDKELLATLQQEIEVQLKELIEVFRSSNISDVERDHMIEKARLQICRFLSEVRRFNNDSLPTKRLEQLWLSNRCKT
ncbi:hypothetical protein [Nitrosomonas ureae]|uniref:Uncharacterized protein n=1 Tax=Nitrosomonas ureae TaxID=44577 RepID=A0A1H9CEM2_9PROT|nr:hypothetical protein [Nitrosomonas ureae]SEP99491.1 hypothetical protein SAMN05421510_101439 [Nitrosomonas ureae]